VPTVSYVYNTASVSGATSYTWTVPTGWTITAGQGTTNLTVTSGVVGQNGNITVTTSNSCGTSAPRTFAVNVNDIPPTAPIIVYGNNNPCHNATGQSYYITSILYATSYTWTVPTGWSITHGQGTVNITVTAGNNGQNGNIKVRANNVFGSSAYYSYPVTVNSCVCPCLMH
jgi:hypothetical protein